MALWAADTLATTIAIKVDIDTCVCSELGVLTSNAVRSIDMFCTAKKTCDVPLDAFTTVSGGKIGESTLVITVVGVNVTIHILLLLVTSPKETTEKHWERWYGKCFTPEWSW